MKKLAFVVLMGALCYACGNSAEESPKTNTTEPADKTATETPKPAEDMSSNPDYTKGLSLIGNSDCLTCHKVDEKLIGPSYRDIANKYENNEANLSMLAEKIIKGGSGVWGQVPMAAHDNISQDDAKAMVKYIFLLKNN